MVYELGIVLIFISFIAGVLTILAPCVAPILPIIIGVSVKRDENNSNHKGLIIISSFMLSVFVFSLLIKWLSEQFGIFQEDLILIAGWILVIFGIFMLFPVIWEKISHYTGLHNSGGFMARQSKNGIAGDVLVGVTLGPVLQSCSPTFGILLANILPGNFLRGVINILAYVLGLGLMLLAVMYGGRALLKKVGRAISATGRFKRILAILIILMGIALIQGLDKDFSLWLAEKGWSIDTSTFEYNLIQKAEQNGN